MSGRRWPRGRARRRVRGTERPPLPGLGRSRLGHRRTGAGRAVRTGRSGSARSGGGARGAAGAADVTGRRRGRRSRRRRRRERRTRRRTPTGGVSIMVDWRERGRFHGAWRRAPRGQRRWDPRYGGSRSGGSRSGRAGTCCRRRLSRAELGPRCRRHESHPRRTYDGPQEAGLHRPLPSLHPTPVHGFAMSGRQLRHRVSGCVSGRRWCRSGAVRSGTPGRRRPSW